MVLNWASNLQHTCAFGLQTAGMSIIIGTFSAVLTLFNIADEHRELEVLHVS